MKKVIIDDLYGISKRIKAIDIGYFVMYDTDKKCYELHHKNERPTYLISLGPRLTRQSIEKVYKSQSKNCLDIFRAIEKTNENLEKYAKREMLDRAKCTLKENLKIEKYF